VRGANRVLSVETIDLSYGASRCLRGVSLEAHPDRITCVLGRNGVGKSSLMRAIVGLERIQSGRIMWEGRDISGLAPAERARAGIGYVPQGREQFLKRRGGDLSGGQQQQLAIARALTARPRLLILDEPTEGIQPSVIKEIARVILLLTREHGFAVVLVEQYYEFARALADRIAVMVRGEVALEGKVDELDDAAVRRLLTV
jgi:urea transport system ATP-binding protein